VVIILAGLGNVMYSEHTSVTTFFLLCLPALFLLGRCETIVTTWLLQTLLGMAKLKYKEGPH